MIRASKKHLAEVDEGYFQHLRFALVTAFRLLCAAVVVFVHALVPALFVRTGSRMIRKLYGKMDKRA